MPRHPHDPFTGAPLPSTSTTSTSLAAPPSQPSTRSNASTASARPPRQPRDLFAPTLSRRPPSRMTPRVEDAVLADPDSDEDRTAAARQQRQTRRARHGSPDGRHGRVKAKPEPEPEFVNRQADGSYLLGGGSVKEAVAPHYFAPEPHEEEEEEEARLDAQFTRAAREYFTSGAALRSTKKQEEELEAIALPMMVQLRHQTMQKIQNERWLYESLNGFQPGMP